jgi:hypothetical protein
VRDWSDLHEILTIESMRFVYLTRAVEAVVVRGRGKNLSNLYLGVWFQMSGTDVDIDWELESSE